MRHCDGIGEDMAYPLQKRRNSRQIDIDLAVRSSLSPTPTSYNGSRPHNPRETDMPRAQQIHHSKGLIGRSRLWPTTPWNDEFALSMCAPQVTWLTHGPYESTCTHQHALDDLNVPGSDPERGKW